MKNKYLKCIILIVVAAFLGFTAIAGLGTAGGSYKNIRLGLDLAGGVSITYQSVKDNPTAEEMEDARAKLQKRAEAKSTESAVYIEGSNRINVDIPNVTDAEKVLEEMGAAAKIYFIYAQGEDGVDNVKKGSSGEYDTLTRSIDEIIESGNVVLDGSHISNAKAVIQTSQTGASEYIVQLTFNEEGQKRFTDATEKAAKYYNPYSLDTRNVIAIVYDGEVVCFPRVNSKITDNTAIIEGQRTYDDAQNLATTIRIGALPIELEEIRSQVVGAKLGAEAVKTSLIAGLVGFIALGLFMIFRYRVPGIAAFLSLIIYVFMMIISLNIFKATLTLPGIAGIILSIGMAVDANVIIFNRIAEEMAAGKTVRSAVKSGFKKARSAIIDGNVTTIIAAIVLYLRGSGTVKGFALTLGIGIVLSMITSMLITRFILTLFVDFGLKSEKACGKASKGFNFDFVGNFKKTILVPAAVLVIGIVFLVVNLTGRGSIFNYSLDFVGGTSTEVVFENGLPSDTIASLENLVKDTLGKNAEVATVSENSAAIIKTTTLSNEERTKLLEALQKTYNVDEKNVESETISSVVSGEMRADAAWATGIAIVCMLLYIYIRFRKFDFAISSVIALIHDVVMVILTYIIGAGLLTVGSTFIACVLTILGYSINATIVIFDRIREEKGEAGSKVDNKDIVNKCISQTMTRSIDTSITTLLMVISLAVFGVDSVREFAIPLLAGIIAGAFSSVMISGPLWHFFESHKKVEEK
ncbi:MAG: protein translocase subunit SecD [Lachnospiraceae bacterium]|nr:protein translocase subunit SecD [Lachnospiraceae bacterium]MBP5184309.1 protein translocase subunit SecD [Lachnospiraceae bacterium]